MKFVRVLPVLILLILSYFSIQSLLEPGFFPMHDDTQVVRVYEMAKAIKDGQFPVRWVADLGYGYGYPIFNFYGPFSYYVGALFVLIGFDVLFATKILFFIATVGSGIWMFFFLRKFVSELPALVGAVAYIYYPYHALNIYVRGAVNEFVASMILPGVLYGFFSLYYGVQKKVSLSKLIISLLVLSVSITLVAVAHNLTFYMLILFLVIFTLISLYFVHNKLRFITLFLAVLFISFLMSAFYTLPALLEMKYTNINSILGGGATISDHYVCPQQLWDSPWGFAGSAKGCIDGMSFKLGKFHSVLTLLSLVLLLYMSLRNQIKQYRNLLLLSVVGLFLSLFMVLSYSDFLWKILPRSDFLQYPWRFLNFAGLFLIVLIALAFLNLSVLFKNKIVFLLLCIFASVTMVVLNKETFMPRYITYQDASYYSDPLYIKYTVSKISDEYMPKNFKKPQKTDEVVRTKFRGIDGVRVISEEVRTHKYSAKVIAEANGLLKLHVAYFPGWQFYVNNRPASYSIVNDGVLIDVPAGSSSVYGEFRGTQLQNTANILSLLGFFILILAIIKKQDLDSYERRILRKKD